MSIYVYMCDYVHVNATNFRGQSSVSNPQEMDSLLAVNHLLWVQGTKFGSFVWKLLNAKPSFQLLIRETSKVADKV